MYLDFYTCYINNVFMDYNMTIIDNCMNTRDITDGWNQGAVSKRKTVLPGMTIPMLKIRRPNGRLIFNMEIAIRR